MQPKVRAAKDYKLYAPSDLTKKWFVSWYDGTTRHRVYADINTGATEAERRALGEALIKRLLASGQPKVSVVEERVRAFLAEQEGKWKRKTREQYRSITEVFFTWLAGRQVTEATVQSFLAEVAKRRHPTTHNKYRRMLKYLLGRAGMAHTLESVASIKAESTPARYLQPHQMTRLGNHIASQDGELWLFVQFMFYCFIRPNELRALRVADILFEERQVRVPAAVSKNSKTQYVVIPDVFLPSMVPLLDMRPGDYIFESPVRPGMPIGVNAMYMRHKKALDVLGFGQGFTLYSWKHSGAVAAVKAGVGLKELQIQLRHHSLDETDKYLRQMGVQDLGQLQKNFPPILREAGTV